MRWQQPGTKAALLRLSILSSPELKLLQENRGAQLIPFFPPPLCRSLNRSPQKHYQDFLLQHFGFGTATEWAVITQQPSSLPSPGNYQEKKREKKKKKVALCNILFLSTIPQYHRDEQRTAFCSQWQYTILTLTSHSHCSYGVLTSQPHHPLVSFRVLQPRATHISAPRKQPQGKASSSCFTRKGFM